MNDGNSTTAVATQATPGTAMVDSQLAAMPTALALFLDDRLYERVSTVAKRMSKATGITPRHLLGQEEACFAVVSRAITWRLDPYAVAAATYQTPGGQVGFEGKLVHAIIENSGKIDPSSGGIRYEHYGDWSKVQGRFEIRESKKQDDEGKAKKYAAATWTDEDARCGKPADQTAYPLAQSCGVRVIAQIRGEKKPRFLDFDLIQAQPRNSTLWATDPMTQICYAAVRRFASSVVPSLIMGVPFDPADNLAPPIDITPDVVRTDDVPMPQARSQAATDAQQQPGPAASQPAPGEAQATSTVASPTAKSASKTDTKPAPKDVDPDTGEVIAPGTAAAGSAAGKAAGNSADSVPASTGMIAHIRKRLEHAVLTDSECFKKFGIDRLEGITVAQANAIIAWTANPAG